MRHRAATAGIDARDIILVDRAGIEPEGLDRVRLGLGPLAGGPRIIPRPGEGLQVFGVDRECLVQDFECIVIAAQLASTWALFCKRSAGAGSS